MGNRANVCFAFGETISPVVYLHWNGGPESIYAFLAEMERRKCRIVGDPSYGSARFAHVACDLFDQEEANGTSCGLLPPPAALTVEAMQEYDLSNHGMYVIESKRGQPWRMRRFVMESWGMDVPCTFRELTPGEVEREREAALNHPYNAESPTIAEAFIAMRPKICRYG